MSLETFIAILFAIQVVLTFALIVGAVRAHQDRSLTCLSGQRTKSDRR